MSYKATDERDKARFSMGYSVDPKTGCWNWNRCLVATGYGRFRLRGTTVNAHVFAYKAFVGVIPDGFHVHHVCENRRCVNYSHLQALPSGEHAKVAETGLAYKNAHKMHCPYGHALVEGNLVGSKLRLLGRRICLTCWKQNEARARERRRNRRLIARFA